MCITCEANGLASWLCEDNLWELVWDMNKIEVSLIFATYKRARLLELMLNSFIKLNTQGFSYQIIAVDNCPQQSAKSIVESFIGTLPIVYLHTTKPGKNAAINLGLEHAQGELLVFTDDDIEADFNWLNSLVDAAGRYPELSIFGGRILPKYPDNFEILGKNIDFSNEFVRMAYGEADWPQPEGPIIAERIWGANMAIRRKLFNQELRFNPHIGPQGSNYVMGSETEFLLRAYAQGYRGIYVPDALVHHHVREEQLSLKWLADRAYRLARGRVQMKPAKEAKCLGGVPRYLFKNYFIRKLQTAINFLYNKQRKFLHVIELSKIRGEITQYRLMQKQMHKRQNV